MKPAATAAAAILLCLLFGLPGLPAQEASRNSRIRVEVNLVNILVSVLDRNGRPVLDLPQDAFELREEGLSQKIERFEAETNQPLDLALMVDTSLSALKELRFEGEAAAHFIRQVVRPGDRLGMFQFSDSVIQLAPYSADVPALQAAARRLTAGAGTAMYDAILQGSQSLARLPADRRRAIVLVTDAGETTSTAKFEDARRVAIQSGPLIYSIVVRPVKNESGRNTAGEHALETITDSTGGALYFPDELRELDAMFDRIDRELRTQYLLGYYPNPRPPAKSYRHIEVRVKGDYTLHFRKTYYSGSTVP